MAGQGSSFGRDKGRPRNHGLSPRTCALPTIFTTPASTTPTTTTTVLAATSTTLSHPLLEFVLREILEMEKVTSTEWLMKYLSWSTLVNLLKRLCYSIVNGMIRHILGEHVNTITTK